MEERKPESAVVVGSGYIGLEMADALVHRGMQVTVVGRPKTVLPTVDTSLGLKIEATLSNHGGRLKSNREVHGIVGDGGWLRVIGSEDLNISTEPVVVAVGVEPNVDIPLLPCATTRKKAAQLSSARSNGCITVLKTRRPTPKERMKSAWRFSPRAR